MKDKIRNLAELKEIVERHKNMGMRIATTNGSFDLLHIGHIYMLESAKRLADILIVLINNDASIQKLKGSKRPIVPEKERAEMLASLECIDYILIFDGDNPLDYIKELKPHLHVKGGTFIPERIKEEKELIESWGGKHITLPTVEGYSTTNLIEKVLKSYDIETKKISPKEKIKDLRELKRAVMDLKIRGKKIVWTNGCFDILHQGHIYLLEKAKSFGDVLIVGLNTDKSVRKLKGENRPIISENERANVLSSLEFVDYVTLFEEDTPCDIISFLKPDVHVKGGDYNPNDYIKMPEAKIIREYGGEIRIVNLLEGHSTSEIIKGINSEERLKY